ncbi:MAG: hypothetical protein HY735_26175 [Verrucomicrobia bacterium]|nr:hypothetical protein [Verrucomicrobiota bacterium]
MPDNTVSLSLTGSVPTPEIFGQYFQQYVIEASTNLVDWFPLVTLQQTNQPTTALTFQDKAAAQSDRGFYRTHTNHFMTPLPQPIGPYAVGTFSRLLTDPSRTNAARGTNRQMMLTAWYPASSRTGLPSALFEMPQLAQDEIFWGRFVDRMPSFVSHSILNAAVSTNQMKYPVVLYAHGVNSYRFDNIDKTEELASQGYIVIALDHRDSISVLPDGSIVNGLGPVTDMVATINDRVLDFQLILEELARLSDSESLLAGHLDLEHVGAFGFLIGGSTAAELCRVDPRCKVGANIEGGFFVPAIRELGLPKPFLILRADAPDGDRKDVYEKLATDAYWVKVGKTIRWNFNLNGLVFEPTEMSRLGAPPPEEQTSGVRTSQITRAYLVAFFNKYLKNQDDHLLDGPSADYPEVMEFLKK